MIAGPHDVLPVRQTATTSGNALRRLVGRISVGSGLICLALGFASIAGAADAKKEPEIRIIPGPRSHHMLPPMPPTSPMPQYEERRPAPAAKRPGKPASELPPLPAEPLPHKAKPAPPQHHKQQQAGGLRIIPGHRARPLRTFSATSRSTAPSRIAARNTSWIRCIGRNSPCRCSSIDSRPLPS